MFSIAFGLILGVFGLIVLLPLFFALLGLPGLLIAGVIALINKVN